MADIMLSINATAAPIKMGSVGLRLPGLTGATGEKGAKGDKGDDGHTPIKGTDYWTTADQASIVADVLAALPDGDGVRY